MVGGWRPDHHWRRSELPCPQAHCLSVLLPTGPSQPDLPPTQSNRSPPHFVPQQTKQDSGLILGPGQHLGGPVWVLPSQSVSPWRPFCCVDGSHVFLCPRTLPPDSPHFPSPQTPHGPPQNCEILPRPPPSDCSGMFSSIPSIQLGTLLVARDPPY